MGSGRRGTSRPLPPPPWVALCGAATESQSSRPALCASPRRSREELAGVGEAVARPFMSVRTVEANLSRTYHKLSVRSRTELANHLNRLDPAPHHE
jgi:hypothetical protein